MAQPPVPADDAPPNRPDDPAPSVEAYEADGGVVLYDAQNPLAWLKGNNATTVERRR